VKELGVLRMLMTRLFLVDVKTTRSGTGDVLVSYCCCNNLPKLSGLNNTVHYLTFL
jgi:hypothetical protein